MSIAQEPIRKNRVNLLAWRQVRWTWQQISLGGVLVLSAILSFYRLDPTYYTNEFYAAGVRSMLTNWSNFFYNAFDPGGYITVDKPPVAFWFQAISAGIFGFNGISILLPSILAGLLTIGLVYRMVGRTFGPTAGLISAFVLALTPISVIMNRHNNPESLLILALVLAAWALDLATERGKLLWLCVGVALVGVGFNIKMLEAFIVLPGFYLLYFLLAPIKWWKRIVHLGLATIVLVVVSFSWAAAVDLTPVSQRPYVGGSGTNSVFSLALNYNGLGRINGNTPGGPGGGGGQRGGFQAPGGQTNGNGQVPGGNAQGAPGGGFPGGGFPGGGGGGITAGQAGPLRMFDPQLAGEAGWFLPLALLGMLVAAVQSFRSFPKGEERRKRQRGLLLWGGWLITFMVVFSDAKGIFHSYYLVMLAPGVAALAGIGLVSLWQAYGAGGWQRWLLPVVLLATAIFELNILSSYTDWNRTVALLMAGIVLVCACALLAVPRLAKPTGEKAAASVVGVALAGLLIAPASWAFNAIQNKTFTNATLPTAVPVSGNAGGFGGFGGRNGTTSKLLTDLQANWSGWLTMLVVGLIVLLSVIVGLRFAKMQLQGRGWLSGGLRLATVVVVITLGLSMTLSALPPARASSGTTTAPDTGVIGNPSMTLNDNAKLIAYLEANRNGSKFLLATTSSQNASPIIIKTGEPVMALGGFMGSDQVLTTQQLAALVQNNTIHYFLLDGAGGFGRGGGGVTTWVQQTCKVVDSSLWSNTAVSSSSTTQGQSARRTQGGFGRGGGGTLYYCGAG